MHHRYIDRDNEQRGLDAAWNREMDCLPLAVEGWQERTSPGFKPSRSSAACRPSGLCGLRSPSNRRLLPLGFSPEIQTLRMESPRRTIRRGRITLVTVVGFRSYRTGGPAKSLGCGSNKGVQTTSGGLRTDRHG